MGNTVVFVRASKGVREGSSLTECRSHHRRCRRCTSGAGASWCVVLLILGWFLKIRAQLPREFHEFPDYMVRNSRIPSEFHDFSETTPESTLPAMRFARWVSYGGT